MFCVSPRLIHKEQTTSLPLKTFFKCRNVNFCRKSQKLSVTTVTDLFLLSDGLLLLLTSGIT